MCVCFCVCVCACFCVSVSACLCVDDKRKRGARHPSSRLAPLPPVARLTRASAQRARAAAEPRAPHLTEEAVFGAKRAGRSAAGPSALARHARPEGQPHQARRRPDTARPPPVVRLGAGAGRRSAAAAAAGAFRPSVLTALAPAPASCCMRPPGSRCRATRRPASTRRKCRRRCPSCSSSVQTPGEAHACITVSLLRSRLRYTLHAASPSRRRPLRQCSRGRGHAAPAAAALSTAQGASPRPTRPRHARPCPAVLCHLG